VLKSVAYVTSHFTSHFTLQVHFYIIFESVCFLYNLAISINKNYQKRIVYRNVLVEVKSDVKCDVPYVPTPQRFFIPV
jgi:hypothetical protein